MTKLYPNPLLSRVHCPAFFNGVIRRLLFGLILFTSGCATLPSKHSQRVLQHELDVPKQWQAQIDAPIAVRVGLLDLFDDVQLNQQVNQALVHNLDLRLAGERVIEAGYLTNIRQARLSPDINAGFNNTRSGGSNQPITENHTLDANVSWEIDLWGKHRSDVQAAELDQQALEQDRLALQDSIAAQVMQAWFDVLGSYQLLRIEQQRFESLRDTEALIQQRYIQGLGTLDDLDTNRVDSANTKASVNQLQQTFEENQRALNILLGRYPAVTELVSAHLPNLNQPPQASVPLDVITNRPDIRAAWVRIVAADERVNVAHKTMYPSLTIIGSSGRQSESLSHLLSGASIWSLAANFTVPVFNAGRLEIELKAADNRANQAYLNYLNIVLRAFSEIENTLAAETLLAERERVYVEALDHAQRSQQNFRSAYLNGNSDILQLLSTQRRVFSAQSSLINVKVARLKNRVTLAMALGKGI